MRIVIQREFMAALSIIVRGRFQFGAQPWTEDQYRAAVAEVSSLCEEKGPYRTCAVLHFYLRKYGQAVDRVMKNQPIGKFRRKNAIMFDKIMQDPKVLRDREIYVWAQSRIGLMDQYYRCHVMDKAYLAKANADGRNEQAV